MLHGNPARERYQETKMRVAELMKTNVRTIAPDSSIADLVQALADSHVSGLPVVSPSGQIVGVVSATDVLQASAESEDVKARANLFQHTTVSDIMTRTPHVIEPDADAREAAQQMLYGEVRRLFVQEKGRLVGVISQTDIAQAVGSGRL
jgi:CBS domain-containing protein